MAEKKPGGWWKWILVLFIIGAVIAAGLWYFKRGNGGAPEYQTTKVTRGDLIQTVTATGILNPVVNVTVGSQVSGRISKLYVDYNSTVRSNQVIAEIDPANYNAALLQATADLANAQANLELQQVQFKRTSELYTNKLVSGSDYDTAVASLHQAESTVKIKQASLNNAQVNLAYCKILSPVDGVVISRAVELGQTVASSFNTPTLFQIANDLTKMQIDTAVDEADIGGIKEGQNVDFTVDAYPNRTFQGVVIQVRNAPTTLNNVVTYDTVIGVTNSDYSLKPGMTASVTIMVAEHHDALEIPNSALRFKPVDMSVVLTEPPSAAGADGTNGSAGTRPDAQKRGRGGRGGRASGEKAALHTVYVLANDAAGKDVKLRAVEIKAGITDNINTEVLSGLKEGDQVVTGLAVPGLSSELGANNPFAPSRRRF